MDEAQEVHRDKQAVLQRIVADVARQMPNGTVPELMDAITAGALASGLQPPPEKWLRDVATSAVAGDVYVLSEEAVRDADVDVPALEKSQRQAPVGREGDQPN